MTEGDDRLPPHALGAPGLDRLARRLARDAHEADDFVQDAWLRALELRPWRRGELEPWLARVVQNLARLARRREGRRVERERSAARGERVESSAELVARAELRRVLVEHLMALREPYREALLLRHLEELPPRAIARRLALPVATVNTRLARGLALLRERLRAGEADGGRGRFLAFAMLARNPVRGGMLAMGTKGKLAGALALAAAACIAVVASRAFVPASDPSAAGRSSLALPGTELERAGTTEPAIAASGDAADRTVAALPPEEDQDRERELRGLVVLPEGEPAAGVALRVLLPSARQVEPTIEGGAPDETLAELRTGPDGRFRAPLEVGRAVDLEVAAPGFARERLPNLYAGEELRIELRPALTLSGRVTLAPSGEPVAGAEVRVRVGVVVGPGSPVHRTVTGEDGSYEIDDLPREHLDLRVYPPGRALAVARIDPPADASRIVRDVAIEPGAALHGRVTDGRSGEPIANASVAASWFQPTHAASTDAEGRYELAGVEPDSDPVFVVRAPGYGCWSFEVRKFPASGMEQDFWLLPSRRAHGRIVDAEGEPIAGASVLARLRPSADRVQRDEVRALSDFAGRFELVDLRADLPHSLLVVARGHATAVVDFPDDEGERDELDLGDVVMKPPASIAGRVIDLAGRPLSDLCVLLTARVARSNDAAPEWFDEGFGAGRVLARTDARGRYAFADLPAGRYWLSAGDKGWARRGELSIELAEGEAPRDVDLQFDPGLSITGTLVDARGEPVVGEAVFAERDLRSVYDLTRAGGRFELFGLDAGEYTLRVHADRKTHEEQSWPAEAGASGLRLVLEQIEFVELEGLVRTLDGDPVPGCTVMRRLEDDRWGNGTTTDRAGRFSMRVPEARPLDLRATPSAAPELTTFFTPFFDADGRWTQRYDGELRGFLPGSGAAIVVLRETPPSVPR